MVAPPDDMAAAPIKLFLKERANSPPHRASSAPGPVPTPAAATPFYLQRPEWALLALSSSQSSWHALGPSPLRVRASLERGGSGILFDGNPAALAKQERLMDASSEGSCSSSTGSPRGARAPIDVLVLKPALESLVLLLLLFCLCFVFVQALVRAPVS